MRMRLARGISAPVSQSTGFLSGFQALRRGDHFAALAVERAKPVEIDGHAALGGHVLEVGKMLAEKLV